MKFKAEPNLFVRISKKPMQRLTGIKGFHFDNNGIYETDNKILCKVLKEHYDEEIKLYKCKKCNFETDNKGLLLAHYKEHKEE